MKKLLFGWLMLGLLSGAMAQKPRSRNAAEIQADLERLNTLGRVMYVAAHPDDENTRLIAWLVNEKKVPTAYFAFTRGDGGQNLIGPEIREELGIIRTQELLQARSVDGGTQYFSRANDFGYSKNPEETFTMWDKQQVLSDLVWAIRNYRPDVLITRFSPTRGRTHGHHTASAQLAMEAFKAAADPKQFPEQLQHTQTWQAKRILWNTSWWFYGSPDKLDKTGLLEINVGAYDPLRGKSITEIAAESRSMHKSQGFGTASERGELMEYLQFLDGEVAEKDAFEGIDMSWNRVKGGDKVQKWVTKAREAYHPSDPAAVVPDLLNAYKALETIDDEFWKQVKQKEIQQLIAAASGLYVEVVADESSKAPGEQVTFSFEAINRSEIEMTLESVKLNQMSFDSTLNTSLASNQKIEFKSIKTLPADLPVSQPYWLKEEGSKGMFTVKDQHLIGKPENPAALTAEMSISIEGEPFTFEMPVAYKSASPVHGEVYEPFVITPPVFVETSEKVLIFTGQDTHPVEVKVTAGSNNVKGNVSLQLPKGWRAEPSSIAFDMAMKGQEQTYSFQVTPPANQSEGEMLVVAQVNEQTYDRGLTSLDYDHFPLQRVFPEAKAKVVKLDVQTKGKYVGYLMGAGDQIPASLEQIGYEVELITPENLQPGQLAKYDAVVLGVRAYNTVESLKFYHDSLMDYVHGGGTLIVQYNTSFRKVRDEVAPYPLTLSRDRVTVEEAEVRFLKPDHALLNFPNKITGEDFNGWVQERGLYFPNAWDERFEAILSSNDPGESPKNGGLLVAKYGKGHYIYTGYSWFRELPAGVPGAYRIFANMLSIGHQKESN